MAEFDMDAVQRNLDRQILVQIAYTQQSLDAALGWTEAFIMSMEPTEGELRRAKSYWREVDRAEAEFRAAFPNWRYV